MILGRDFDIQVKSNLIATVLKIYARHSQLKQMLKEYEKSALAKKNQLLHLLEI